MKLKIKETSKVILCCFIQIMHKTLFCASFQPVHVLILGLFPGGISGEEHHACQCRRHRRCGFHPWVRKIPWRRAWQPTPVFLPGESQATHSSILAWRIHGQRSVLGYVPLGRKESDTIEAT